MAEIGQLLHRRSDLSTFLVHLTRDDGATTARSNLLSILMNRRLEARSMLGLAARRAGEHQQFRENQKVVCFSETPLEQTWMMCEEIARRSVRLSHYGVAFTKAWARRQGANPVWYVDQTPGHDWLSAPLNELIDLALGGAACRMDGGRLTLTTAEDSQIAWIAPFIETMGPSKDFAWEREWRKVGHLAFGPSDLVAVFAPAYDHQALLADSSGYFGPNAAPLKFLDPTWGLEAMIAHLAGVVT